MELSLPRYLLTRVAVPGAIINVVINALIGRAAHPAGRVVPLGGDGGIAGDTVVNAVIIGFLTLLGVSLAARAEARAGRVRGFGRRADSWLGWAQRHIVLAALALGVATAVVLALPTVAALHAAGVTALSRDGFVVFRAG